MKGFFPSIAALCTLTWAGPLVATPTSAHGMWISAFDGPSSCSPVVRYAYFGHHARVLCPRLCEAWGLHSEPQIIQQCLLWRNVCVRRVRVCVWPTHVRLRCAKLTPSRIHSCMHASMPCRHAYAYIKMHSQCMYVCICVCVCVCKGVRVVRVCVKYVVAFDSVHQYHSMRTNDLWTYTENNMLLVLEKTSEPYKSWKKDFVIKRRSISKLFW